MKRLLLIPALVLTLAACGTKQEVQSPTIKDEAAYVAALRADGGYYGRVAGSDELIKLGYTTCASLDSGSTIQDLMNDALAIQDDADVRQFIPAQLAASVVWLCPWNKDGFDNLKRGS